MAGSIVPRALGVVHRANETRANGVLDLVLVDARLACELPEKGRAAQREHELFARDAERAAAPSSAERTICSTPPVMPPLPTRTLGARVGHGNRPIGAAAQRCVSAGQADRDRGRDEHGRDAPHRRTTASVTGTSAASASAAPSRNELENAFVAAQSS